MEVWKIIAAVVAVGTVLVLIGRWTSAVDHDRRTFNAFMSEIRDDIKRILERLPRQTEGSASPIRLTDLGRQVSAEIGAVDLANDLAAQLRPRLVGKEEFEIQEACLHFVEHEYRPSEEVSTLIGRSAYNNGLERRQVLRVIGLELRDILLRG